MKASEGRAADWLARHILPCEPAMRRWLRHAGVASDQIDDVIQEAYARIVDHGAFEQILNPAAYFQRIARNILLDQLRRQRIVRMETLTELDLSASPDEMPDAERQAAARQEIERLRRLVDALPPRCRQMFVMRKIEGISQKEIGRRLGVSENTVETQVRRGLQIILAAWSDADPPAALSGGRSRADHG